MRTQNRDACPQIKLNVRGRERERKRQRDGHTIKYANVVKCMSEAQRTKLSGVLMNGGAPSRISRSMISAALADVSVHRNAAGNFGGSASIISCVTSSGCKPPPHRQWSNTLTQAAKPRAARSLTLRWDVLERSVDLGRQKNGGRWFTELDSRCNSKLNTELSFKSEEKFSTGCCSHTNT